MPLDLVHLVGTRLPRLCARAFPDMLFRHRSRTKCCYLTFDDGPCPDSTGRLLEILDRFDAAATFFLIGRHAQRDPGLVRAVAGAGHTIGNHSFTHPNAADLSPGALIGELDRTTHLLEDLLGRPVRWMRPPYGRFTRAMRDWCLTRRHRLTMWDVGPGDFLDSATRANVGRRVVDAVRPGSIVALHDNPRAARVTPDALRDILERLTDQGWRFSKL